ncbi:type II toxin-antitoxin system MqsA family antitoxin [Sphaerospermopsis sp. FACHB-1194]|uniref:type II toxin-antitoxin system MqsA family antitoxin n=1 Tax=Sphaerospermopsis sp. FACHB-1194 TaxID=2692862 RepID=UPI0018EF83FA|nr:type II toxin-antitoxin system MqsA family antitoxin [Sphaerospermopsis sp. FACHB-1194]
MREIKCNFCGSPHYEQRQIDYLYRHQGQYLLVPNTPVQICLDCGMIYYDAKILKKIEQYFFIKIINNLMNIYLFLLRFFDK